MAAPGPSSGGTHAPPLAGSSGSRLIDRALGRAGEAPRIDGNTVMLLRDGPAVFSAWLADIAAARRFVLLENYIFRDDRIGNTIADALIERAQAEVEVCLLYDWLGCLGTSRKLWLRLRNGGVKVRVFRPMRLIDPLAGLKRNHRKVLCIDGVLGHVGGLCIGDAWAGDPEHGVPPWRDTAVRICGPAAAELCRSFDETWSQAGAGLPHRLLEPAYELPDAPPPLLGAEIHEGSACSGAPVRVVSGLPGRSRIFRLTQVLLASAAERIWITDAYFLTPPTMYEALIAAARDGVDVRVLLPGRSDLPWVAWLGRAGYFGLLEAGVRMFEWDGPMLHAKTMVVDGRFCRVGSSNLNLASLLTNWELDVLIEDEGVGAAMEQMFLADLATSRELELRPQRLRGRIRRGEVPSTPEVLAAAQARGSVSRPPTSSPGQPRPAPVTPVSDRAHAAVVRAGAAVLGVALRRRLERTAWTVSLVLALLMIGIGALGIRWPTQLGWTVTVLCLWLAAGALVRSFSEYRSVSRTRRRGRRRDGKRSRGHTPVVGAPLPPLPPLSDSTAALPPPGARGEVPVVEPVAEPVADAAGSTDERP
ncbi:MAG: phospholipase D-like domain-containing protein [Polyangia bacterium]